jgi:hypothetical protein
MDLEGFHPHRDISDGSEEALHSVYLENVGRISTTPCRPYHVLMQVRLRGNDDSILQHSVLGSKAILSKPERAVNVLSHTGLI